jgi:hypothetical protein
MTEYEVCFVRQSPQPAAGERPCRPPLRRHRSDESEPVGFLRVHGASHGTVQAIPRTAVPDCQRQAVSPSRRGAPPTPGSDGISFRSSHRPLGPVSLAQRFNPLTVARSHTDSPGVAEAASNRR